MITNFEGKKELASVEFTSAIDVLKYAMNA